jgi:AcrR family transcriptional regulator
MPKLHPKIIDANREKIERVALRLFCAQGFHGTSMRQIAQHSRVSLGNIYNYYKTKDELFTSIVNHYAVIMNRERQKLLDSVQDPFDPRQIEAMARLIRRLVFGYGDFWLLMYVDVTEFGNRHFKKFFPGLTDLFRRQYQAQFSKRSAVREEKGMKEVDPAVVFAAMWMQFFNYFLVERLFRGSHHLGMSDKQVIETFSDFYRRLQCQ